MQNAFRICVVVCGVCGVLAIATASGFQAEQQEASQKNGDGVNAPTLAQRETAALAALHEAQARVIEKENQNTNNILVTIFASLSASGGVGALLLKLQANKYQQDLALRDRASDDKEREKAATETLIENLRREVDRLGKRVAHYEEELRAIREEYNRTRERLGNLELHGNESPAIVWEADSERIVTAINSEFEKQLLAPLKKKKSDAVGKTFYQIFGKEAGEAVERLDDAAIISPQKQQFTLNVKFSDLLPLFMVAKTIRMFNGRIIGVYGSAMSMSNFMAAENHAS